MQVNPPKEIPVDTTARTFYPWEDLTEVGMSFFTESVHGRQLVYAANKSHEKRGSPVKFKAFKESVGFMIYRIK